jgi:hypothetical protein
MRECFPESLVTDYEDLIPVMTNNPKDAHVLAAAIRCSAHAIVTDNKHDFPPHALKQYPIECLSAGEFLEHQYNVDNDALSRLSQNRRRTSESRWQRLPRIFDNIDKQLLPTLKLAMQNSNRGDFCVGYLNLRVWRQLDKQIESWSGQNGSCCRLLAGMQRLPEHELHDAYRLLQGDPDPDNPAIRLKKRLAQEFRSQLTIGAPTDADEAGLRRLVNPAIAFLGSSNPTFAGLSKQGELNVDVMDHDSCQKLAKWFDERWND